MHIAEQIKTEIEAEKKWKREKKPKPIHCGHSISSAH